MRRAETTPKRLLLLPLIPALAFGIVEVATELSTVEMRGVPPATPTVVIVEPDPITPIPPIAIDLAPIVPSDPDDCHGCVMSL